MLLSAVEVVPGLEKDFHQFAVEGAALNQQVGFFPRVHRHAGIGAALDTFYRRLLVFYDHFGAVFAVHWNLRKAFNISAHYLRAMRENRAVNAIAELLGPNLKFHHCKINAKLPGTGTEVKFHQDFLYEPHSNDDLITALMFIDEVTEQNGPLEVLPGSDTGPLYGLWHDGVFTGAIDRRIADRMARKTVKCTGAAGAACLMHTRLVHGSAANLSTHPRTLFIAVYSAEDALPLCPNPLPSRYAGEVVRGRRTNRVRYGSYAMDLPEVPESASFFDQQAKQEQC